MEPRSLSSSKGKLSPYKHIRTKAAAAAYESTETCGGARTPRSVMYVRRPRLQVHGGVRRTHPSIHPSSGHHAMCVAWFRHERERGRPAPRAHAGSVHAHAPHTCGRGGGPEPGGTAIIAAGVRSHFLDSEPLINNESISQRRRCRGGQEAHTTNDEMYSTWGGWLFGLH